MPALTGVMRQWQPN